MFWDNKTPSDCPTTAELLGFDAGELALPVLEQVAQHVGDCEACRAFLTAQRAAPSPLVAQLRNCGKTATFDTEPEFQRLEGRARAVFAEVGTFAPLTPQGDLSGTLTRPPGQASGPPAVFTGLPNVPGFEVLDLLGQGGMGVVYKARQLGLNRLVALKMVRHVGSSKESLRRFRAEAELVARLQHPNIVQVYEIGEHEGSPYFALEFVNGGDLAQRLRAELPAPRAAARLTESLARAIHVAHAQGIIHRDLKPHNVVLAIADSRLPIEQSSIDNLQSAIPKITDFGLAKHLDSAMMTASGAMFGTPCYMAPEQATGNASAVSPATDVWALGAILFEMMTGRPPFRAASAMDTIYQVLHHEVTPLRQIQPTVPADLETICLKCLQKEPTKRYASADALAEDLRRFQVGEPILARPVSAAERLWRWCRRNPAIAAALAGMAFLLVSIAVVSTVLGELAWRSAGEERQARLDAVAALGKADAEEKKAQGLLYASRLALVQSFWRQGNLLSARDMLDEAQDRRDSWEFRYLHNLLNYHGQRTLFGHVHRVTAVAFSPDGRRLASCSWDQTVRIWDVTTRQEILTLDQHTGATNSVAWSPDGERLISGSRDRTVRVWNAHSGEQVLVLQGHTGPVNGVAFSSDGKEVASASQDQTVRIWDAATGKLLRTLVGHTKDVSAVAFSPDGQRLASASQDRTLRIWDLRTAETVRTLDGHSRGVNCVVFSPDGQWLASGSGADEFDKDCGEVRVWHAATGQQKLLLPEQFGPVMGVSFSPDGNRLAAGTGTILRNVPSPIRVWDVPTGKQLLRLQGHNVMVTGVSFSPDGRQIASGSWDQTVRVWDAINGQEPLTIAAHDEVIPALAFSPDGTQLVSGSKDKTVKVWDARSGGLLRTLEGLNEGVFCLAFSPDGRWLVSAGGDQVARVWNTATGKEQFRLARDTSHIYGIAFSPDGKCIATSTASNSPESTVKVWDAQTGACLLTIGGLRAMVWSVNYSVDGQRLATGSDSVKVWDANTGQLIFDLGRESGSRVVFSPDGRRLATGSLDHLVRIWDAQTGQLLRVLKGHAREIYGLTYSPDGRRIASASNDWTVKLWDASSGQELLTLAGHAREVWSVCFSPDGTRLASASGDGVIKLWDAPAQPETIVLDGHKALVRSVCFSPNGRRLVSAGDDGTVRLWDAATGKELRKFSEFHYARCAVFSSDGRRIVAGGDFGMLRVWDAAAGANLFALQGHTEDLNCVCFSRDGQRVASGSADQTVRVWDARTGKELHCLKGHTSSVIGVCFSPDGSQVISRDIDGQQITWDLATGRPAATEGMLVPPASPRSPDGQLFAFKEDKVIRIHKLPTSRKP